MSILVNGFLLTNSFLVWQTVIKTRKYERMFEFKKIFSGFYLDNFFFMNDWFIDSYKVNNKSNIKKNKLIKPINKNIKFKLSKELGKGWYLIGLQYFGEM